MNDRPSRRNGRRPAAVTVREDVERELRAHLELRIEELLAAGLSSDEAQRRARAEFGNVEQIAAECRRISRAPSPHRTLRTMIDSIRQDLTFALRSLRKSPLFVVTAVLTLGLGIGANAAIFSVVNSVLLRPLPYPDPDRIVAIWERSHSGVDNNIAAPNFVDWRDQNSTFESMAMMPTYKFGGRSTVLGGDAPARLWVGGVTREFFDVLGIEPMLGRTFVEEELQEGAPPTAIVSHAVWRDLLGGQTDLSAISLSVYGYAARVVGVMPPGFSFPQQTDIWFPQEIYGWGDSRTSHNFAAVGRLLPGVTIAQAQADLDAIGAALLVEYGEQDTDAEGANVYALRDELVGDGDRQLMLLLGASGLVLLVACTNIASALLARGASRQQEIAVRSSLGAGRKRIVRQLLTESVLLAALGAAAGLVLASSLQSLLIRSAPSGLPGIDSVGIDATVLLFSLALTGLTAILFGLVPALRLTRGQIAGSLRGTRSVSGGNARGWSLLVVAEIALAVILLVGAGLLMRSFWQVVSVDAGFEAEGVLTVDVSLPSDLYETDAEVARFHQRLLTELRALPGVRNAGMVSHLPLHGAAINGGFAVEGREAGAGYADYRVASPGYFEAMGIPVLRGRSFDESDTAQAPGVVVINEALARDLWPDDDPIGKRIGNFANDGWVYGTDWLEIVGVVGDVRHRDLTRGAARETYVHYAQRPMRARGAVITLQTDRDPTALIPMVRERLTQLDDQVPADYETMRAIVSGSVADRRFTVTVLGAFAAVALLLAAIGIYGVVSYSVARRTREMGIRMALGAQPRSVRRLVVGSALRTVAIGLAIGTAVAMAASRVIASLLYDVQPTDPSTFGAVILLLLAVGWLASTLPARRCARIDPMLTMRAE